MSAISNRSPSCKRRFRQPKPARNSVGHSPTLQRAPVQRAPAQHMHHLDMADSLQDSSISRSPSCFAQLREVGAHPPTIVTPAASLPSSPISLAQMLDYDGDGPDAYSTAAATNEGDAATRARQDDDDAIICSSDDDTLPTNKKQRQRKQQLAASASASTSTAKAKRFYFDNAADVTVFREILSEDGLFVSDGCTMNERWQRVHCAVRVHGIRSSLPTLKARVSRCVEKYNAALSKSKKMSGVDEENESELDALIREYVELDDEYRRGEAAARMEKKRKEAEEATEGKQIRDAAARRMSNTESSEGGGRRGSGPHVLQEYVEMQKVEIAYKRQKMELEAEQHRFERAALAGERRLEREAQAERMRIKLEMQAEQRRFEQELRAEERQRQQEERQQLFALLQHLLKKQDSS